LLKENVFTYIKKCHTMSTIKVTKIACPNCGNIEQVEMPDYVCVRVYKCPSCEEVFHPTGCSFHHPALRGRGLPVRQRLLHAGQRLTSQEGRSPGEGLQGRSAVQPAVVQ